MSIKNTHPDYAQKVPDWEVMRDTYKGSRVVKSKTTKYLPATAGMLLDGMSHGCDGLAAYDSYRLRAVFPEYVKEAVENYVGMLWRRPATIKLPKGMEGMRDFATPNGESLVNLLRRINEEQLVNGRCGLLLDLPQVTEDTTLPYIALYDAEAIINWDENVVGEGHTELNFVVLNETSVRRTNGFNWEVYEKYRLLLLGELDENESNGEADYHQGVFTQDGTFEYDPSNMITPVYKGVPLKEVPFVFVNTKDLTSNPDEPPLLALANQSLAIYRAEADYRQTLYMMGQDTLVIIGAMNREEDEKVRIGSGAALHIEQGGDAKFIGVDGRGLPEQRYALVNDRLRAEIQSGQLSNSNDKVESGIALQTRLGAQTSTLMQIAISGAAALEKILKLCAKWMGLNENEVEVHPNLEFAVNDLEGQDLLMYMQAIQLGAPISHESVHRLALSKGLTTMTYEDELIQIEKEIKEGRRVTVPQNAGLQVPNPANDKPVDKPKDSEA